MHFFKYVYSSMRNFSWKEVGAVSCLVFVIYGMLLFNPVTAYDFNSAKGDFLQVFLTYFFMHRIGQALLAGCFHDFSPFWTISIGLVFLICAGLLLLLLFRRLGFRDFYSLLGVALWLSTPFFFNRSIYQHAFPVEAIGFCCDILAMLAFLELRRRSTVNRKLFVLIVLLAAISASIYQAHVNLLLTGLMGIVVLDRKNSCHTVVREWVLIAGILAASVGVWFAVNHGPMVFARMLGFVIPKSGGAHDTIFWISGDHTFWVNLKSLFVGCLLNWGYNAFFIVGLRCVILAILFCFAIGAAWGVRRNWYSAIAVFGFAASVFVFPTIQCSFANLRTFYCFIPLISFSGLLLLQISTRKAVVPLLVIVASLFAMAHETSTLYYYNWKVKEHDKLHMSIVAHDLWEKYGLRIKKPVAIIGGWKHYPTCWEDLRPFRQLPLINHPFTTYSNMTCVNVPREFYMVAREKVGLLIKMTELDTYAKLRLDMSVLQNMPAYPQQGYIFEHDSVIVVNLGCYNTQWDSFRFCDYATPNEVFLDSVLRMDRIDSFLMRTTAGFRALANAYPWTVALEP